MSEAYDTNAPELLRRFREILVSVYGAESDLTNARSKIQRIEFAGSPDNEILAHSRESIPADNICQVKIKSVLTLSQFYLGLDEIHQLLDDDALKKEFFSKLAPKASRVYATEERVFETTGLLLKFLK